MTCLGSQPGVQVKMDCAPGCPNGTTKPLGLVKLIGSEDIQTLPWISGSILTSTIPVSSSQGSQSVSPLGRMYFMRGRTSRCGFLLSHLSAALKVSYQSTGRDLHFSGDDQATICPCPVLKSAVWWIPLNRGPRMGGCYP